MKKILLAAVMVAGMSARGALFQAPTNSGSDGQVPSKTGDKTKWVTPAVGFGGVTNAATTNTPAGLTNFINSLATNVVNNNSSPQVWTNDNGTNIYPVSYATPVTVGTNVGANVVSTRVRGSQFLVNGAASVYGDLSTDDSNSADLLNVILADTDRPPQSGPASLNVHNRTKFIGVSNPGVLYDYEGSVGISVVQFTYPTNAATGESAGIYVLDSADAAINYGIGILNELDYNGTTNIGLASSLSLSGHTGTGVSIYGEITSSEAVRPVYEDSVMLLDNRTTSKPLIIARTNNGTTVFKVDGAGNLDMINKVRYQWPGTNLLPDQVFASDGGTPQQIYGVTPASLGGQNNFSGSNYFGGILAAAEFDIGSLVLTNYGNLTTNSATLSSGRVQVGDGGRGVANATASGSVPIDADGTATTFAQVNALAPGYVVTNNNANALVLSNTVAVDAAHSLSLSNVTASSVLGTDASRTLTNINIGTGLSFSGNTLSSTVSGGAATSEAFVTIGNTSGLSTERALTSGQISVTDNGANSTVTIGATSDTPQFARIGLGQSADGTVAIAEAMTIAANTVTPGLMLTNAGVATTANQRYSPALLFGGQSFNSSAKGEQFRMYMVPLQGAGNYLKFDSATNSSATFGFPITFDFGGNITNAGDLMFGTSGGSHHGYLIGPHATSGVILSSDSPSTLSYAVNGTSFTVQNNGSAKWTFSGNSPFNLTPSGGDNTQSIGQGGGATARLKNIVMAGSVTNDINGAGSGCSIDIAAGGGLTSNGAGSDMNIIASQANGTGRSGAIITRTAPTLQSSGSTQNALVVRNYLSPKRVNLTETNATIVFNVSLASGKWCSLRMFASTQADDGTERQVMSDELLVSAVNKAGTVTTGTSTIGVATSAGITTGASTLTTAWTAVANGNGVDVKCNATSSLVQTTLATYWRVEVDTDDTALAVTPQ